VGAALVTTVTAALSVTLVASPTHAATPSASRSTVAGPGVFWSARRAGFQCPTVLAPLDYDRPHGVQIGISVIRLPAGEPGQRIGSLLLNPGGPGGSGVDFARDLAKSLPPEGRARFDIVGVSP